MMPRDFSYASSADSAESTFLCKSDSEGHSTLSLAAADPTKRNTEIETHIKIKNSFFI
jgi:hypothetical protein